MATDAQTEARAIAALFDDIYSVRVRDGFCDWADVANARDEALRIIAAALAAKDAELAEVEKERDEIKSRSDEAVRCAAKEYDRRLGAEARLDEARKALDLIAALDDNSLHYGPEFARRAHKGGADHG